MVSGRLHGIARYALELARVLPSLAPDLTFEGLGPPGGLPELGPLAPAFPVHPAPAGFLSPLEQPALAAVLRRLRPALFHATSFSVPLLWRGPLVATLHDAAHLVRSAEFGRLTAVYYRVVVRPTVQRARALLTVSEFARGELASRLGVPESRWSVVPPGVDAALPAAHGGGASRRSGRSLGLPPRYLLAVGNSKPYKNLALLARIAARLPVPLVLLAGDGAGAGLPPAHPGAVRGGRGAPPRALRQRRGPAAPLAARGLRAACARGDGHRDAGARRQRRLAPGGDRRRGRAARPGRSGGVDRREQRARGRHRCLRARWASAGRERARAFTWERCARHTLAVYRSALG